MERVIDGTPSAALDALIDDTVRVGDAPGLVAIVAGRDGVRYARAAGSAGAPPAPPMALDTIMWLASMSKLITSIAALQLVEQGRLALDAPLAPLLPELAAPSVVDGFDESGRARLRPARHALTLRHLLTHTAGMGYEMMNPELLRAGGAEGPPRARTLASLRVPLLFDPGDGWEYGFATDWAGLAVEAATGRPLDAYLADHVLGPLGMADTGFDVPAGKAPRRAGIVARGTDGGFVAMPSLVGERADWEFCSGGGGLSGTAGDYVRLLRMLLCGGTLGGVRILGAEGVATMFRNQIGTLRGGATGSAAPAICTPFDLFPETRTGWSLAGMINPEDVPGGRRAGSLGWAGVANTHYWVDPAAGICAVLMTQLLPFADVRLVALLRRFERAVYADYGRGA